MEAVKGSMRGNIVMESSYGIYVWQYCYGSS